MTGHEHAETSAGRVEQPGERETANHSGLEGAHTARAAERSGHRPDYARHEAIVALTAWQPADSSIGTVVLPGKVSNGSAHSVAGARPWLPRATTSSLCRLPGTALPG